MCNVNAGLTDLMHIVSGTWQDERFQFEELDNTVVQHIVCEEVSHVQE